MFIIHNLTYSKNKSTDNEQFNTGDNHYNNISIYDRNKPIKMSRSEEIPSKEFDYDEYHAIDYLTDNITPQTETCILPPKSTKKFHSDFFSFRDKTNLNSSVRKDTVDNINNMILNGNLEQARSNMKIKDIYDEAVKLPSRYNNSCVRQIKFDNINPHGWQDNYGTPGMSLVQNEWKYDNENILNGGKITENITGYDPNFDNKIDLQMYQ